MNLGSTGVHRVLDGRGTSVIMVGGVTLVGVVCGTVKGTKTLGVGATVRGVIVSLGAVGTATIGAS